MKVHGLSGTREYQTWSRMLARCYRPGTKSYKYCGGRGITVCDRWRKSYPAFLRDMGKRPEGTSLDRINAAGNYCPENCRWADGKTQQRNKLNNRRLTVKGVTKCLVEFAEEYGKPANLIWHRLKRGWNVERALITPRDERFPGRKRVGRYSLEGR